MKPTYEELEAKVQRLEELLKQALEKISQLEEQIKRNSKNSSKPPSTDQKGNTPDADNKPPRNSRAGRYAVYNSFKDHQFCLAHLIREFKGHGERDGPDKAIGHAIENELRLSCKIHRDYCEGKIPLAQRNRRLGVRKRRIEYWLEDGLANGSDALAKICGTLLEDFEKLWTFTRILGMEPTNNMAERDLRKLVIWRRKSYGTRSNRGKKFVERVTTVAQTIRKQGGNVLHFIQEAIECFYSRILPPLISEAMGF